MKKIEEAKEKSFDELIEVFVDLFKERLHSAMLKEADLVKRERLDYPMQMDKKTCAHMLYGTTDPTRLDRMFLIYEDFPVIKGEGRDQFPRDQIIEWYDQNWRRLKTVLLKGA